MAGSRPQSNFTHLEAHDEQLVRLGLLAERYFAEDPNTCLIKLRQLEESSQARSPGAWLAREADTIRRAPLSGSPEGNHGPDIATH